MTQLNVCLPIRDFHRLRRKFSIIWLGSRGHRTRSTAFFIGGCSTRAFEAGRRKLRKPSRNLSNEVFSRKSDLRTAKYFTTSLRITSPLFSSGHRQPPDCNVLAMTTHDEIQWFAIQARPGAEAAAESNLGALPIETFLPLARRLVHHATRTPRMVLRPLFPGYLFGRFCADPGSSYPTRASRLKRGARCGPAKSWSIAPTTL